MSSTFSKYDYIKIQEQYIPQSSDNPELFLKQVLDNRGSLSNNYEIVLAVKQDKEWTILEMTFDPKGTFLGQRTIKQDSYEYIMY